MNVYLIIKQKQKKIHFISIHYFTAKTKMHIYEINFRVKNRAVNKRENSLDIES